MKNPISRSIGKTAVDAVTDHVFGIERNDLLADPLPEDTGHRFRPVVPVTLDASLHSSIQPRQQEKFRAGFIRVVLRLLVMIAWAVYMLIANTIDRITFRGSIERRAKRLRLALQGLGGGAVKFGQQLAIRVDLIPYAYADELKNLLDSGSAISFAKAKTAIERALGSSIEETFDTFDDTPIASASIACVYKGVLKDGATVAVKVRRPGIGSLLAADIRAITWAARILELFYLPPGFTSRAMRELEAMLLEELDFVREARYSEIFRNDMLNAKFKFATSPRIYFHLSSSDVMISEFVFGYSLKDISEAVERNDTEALERFAAQNISPRKLARRMLKVHRFGGLEGHVFNADPHPGNIIVRPDNEMVFIDFGSCGMFTESQRVLWRRFLYARSIEDVSAMVQAGLAILEPLDRIDVDDFAKEMEYVFWQDICVFRSSNSQAWERNSAFMWFQFLGLTRKYRLAMNSDTLRMIRVTMLSDSLATRLDPEIDHFQEYLRYVRGANERAKTTLKLRKEQNLEAQYIQAVQLFDLTTSALFRAQRLLDAPFANFRAFVGKTAFIVGMLIKVSLTLLVVSVVFISSWLSLDGLSNSSNGFVASWATELRNFVFETEFQSLGTLPGYFTNRIAENWWFGVALLVVVVLPLVRRVIYELDTMDR